MKTWLHCLWDGHVFAQKTALCCKIRLHLWIYVEPTDRCHCISNRTVLQIKTPECVGPHVGGPACGKTAAKQNVLRHLTWPLTPVFGGNCIWIPSVSSRVPARICEVKCAIPAGLLVCSISRVQPSQDCDVQSMLICLLSVCKEAWGSSGWQHYLYVKSLFPVLPMKILTFTTYWHLPKVEYLQCDLALKMGKVNLITWSTKC